MNTGHPTEPIPSHDSSTPRLMAIMFTDLVGSTHLKEAIGPTKYRALKLRHDHFLNQALLNAPSARVLQDTGDGFFVSFASVAQAISSALVFQALMLREPWEHPFKSRVGLHLGEVQEGHNAVTGAADFISSAIDLASRTMSLGMGGQILVTRSVFEAVRHVISEHPVLPDGSPLPKLRWVSHGHYLCKGATDPIEVFEVGGEGIAPLSPPPNSDKVRRHKPLMGEGANLGRRHLVGLVLIFLLLLGAIGFGLFRHFQSSGNSVANEMERAEVEHQVARLKAEPMAMLKANPPNATEVELAQMSENADFEVLRDERVCDMRGWKDVPTDKVSELFSPVTFLRKISLKKIGPASRFEWQNRTTGLNLFVLSPGPYPYEVEVQRGQTITGKDRMKVCKVSVDVSSVKTGEEALLNSVVTMWNSLQTEEEQWVGLIGYHKSFLTSMLILFPENKPYKDIRLTVSQTTKSDEAEYTGPRVLISGPKKDWIYWKVANPESGHVYRVHWKW